MSLHRRLVHPEPVEDCFGCRVSTLHVGLPPTNDAAARERTFQENFGAQFHNGDREAYKRLRANGLQPRSVDGSAHLERHATTRFEVETGRVYEDKKALHEALSICESHGFDPLKANSVEKAG